MEKTEKKQTLLSVILLAAAGGLIYAVSAGIRQNYGVLMSSIAENSGVTFAQVSFVVALGKLIFGITQPLFGVLALKKSHYYVLYVGALLAVLGLAVLPFCKGMFMLIVFLGFIVPAGTGAMSFGVIMGALTPLLGESHAATVSGVVSASSGLGNIILSPALQGFLDYGGLKSAAFFLAGLSILLIPVFFLVSRKDHGEGKALEAEEKSSESMGEMFKKALKNRNYLCLSAGFFTCGFTMGIVEMHYYNVVVHHGFSEQTAALALSVFGLTSILGSLLSGVLCSKMKNKDVLGMIYSSRFFFIIAFVLLPKTLFVIMAWAAIYGLIGSCTVPPTSGLCGKLFGSARLASLFGLAFAINQTGAFISVWLSGVCISSLNTYTPMWIAAAVISGLAGIACYSIREN